MGGSGGDCGEDDDEGAGDRDGVGRKGSGSRYLLSEGKRADGGSEAGCTNGISTCMSGRAGTVKESGDLR